ncbi:hypothetical protein [Burkholderia cenocepacia]|jgi:hypothetical protein|uniref:hypothetical protein n=1 Tax=Burkholderia cenocepacia TaxID=95486 RepID=UPI000F5C25E7|nr:hypothetical protein [Burkholderia cenocepacia]
MFTHFLLTRNHDKDTIIFRIPDSRKSKNGKLNLLRSARRWRKAVLTRKKAKTDMGITVAELRRNELSEDYEVRIFLGPLRSWQICLLTTSGKVVDVETKRATPKSWRHFEDAVDFVREHCVPSAPIVVEIDGLVLRQGQK